MALGGWRTLVLDSHESLSLSNNQIIVKDDECEVAVPLESVREVFAMTDRGHITLPLLVALSKQNTKVVFCDEKRDPICELCGYGQHTEEAGRIMDQVGWKERRKDAVWRQIVKMKIGRQIDLLERMNCGGCDELKQLQREVMPGDKTNREAIAAKVYFAHLFGMSFQRFEDDDINAALNYGYAILRSFLNCTIVFNGFSMALGIHHCNRQNPFNLSCDLMEPFRPFVDEIVAKHLGCEFDFSYRLELIEVLRKECQFGDNRTTIETALEAFTQDVIRAMSTPKQNLSEVHFA